MHRLLFIFLLCGLPFTVFGQKVIIAVEFQNRLVCGIHNYFTIAAENIPNDSLFLKTNNGVVTNDEGFFKTTPTTLGEATISIYKIHGHDTLFLTSQIFQVINVGEYAMASFDNKSEGAISLKRLRATHQLTASVENLAFHFDLRIASYRVMILRNDSLIFTKHYESDVISKEVKEIFRTELPGDIIYFLDIQVLTPVNLTYTLNSIRLRVE